MVESDEAAIKIGHARGARDEMKRLADEFRSLARKTSVPTPAMDRLYQYMAPAVESVIADRLDTPTNREHQRKREMR
jgi:hypothetical protein